MPEPPGPEIERWERVELEIRPLRAGAELTATAQAAAFANDRVRQLVRGGRSIVLGASQLTDGKGVDQPVTVLLAYDYETQRAIRVRLTGEGESQRVEAVEETSDQPSPSDGEIEEAITLARYAEGVVPHLTSDDKANALLASSVEPGDRYYGRRLIVVVFGPPDQRLPRVRALVDLSSRQVLGVDIQEDSGEEADR
jgi:hypothetical protein